MAEVERAINDILIGEKDQEKQSNRIAHYERAKSRLKETLKKIDADEREATSELTVLHEKYGIVSWSFDNVFEFQNRREKAWNDYGKFLQTEKASLDKAKVELMEQQECAETSEKMKTAEGYLDVALNEWKSVQPVKPRRTASSVTVYPDEDAPDESSRESAGTPKRLNVLGDIVDRAKRDMFEWKQKNAQQARDRSLGKEADDYIETSRRKNNAIISLYHKVTQRQNGKLV